ncbi:MAG: hypothetical protein R2747_17725 [Pyrinomonadaceae bacterium]
MGQIIIDIPQHLEFKFRIVENKAAEEILLNLRNLIDRANESETDDISGIWADCNRSAPEIALGLRRSWKRKLSHG